jgi:hypothetical protein
MHAKSRLMLKVLLDHYHHGAVDALLRRLPSNEMEAVLLQEVSKDAPGELVINPKAFFSNIHYSWLQPLLKGLPAPMLSPYLLSLPQQHRQGLSSLFKVTLPYAIPSPRVQKYLLKDLYAKMADKPSLPAAMLPTTSLSPLLAVDKATLTTLVEMISMYDLADKIQRIVDKNRLKQIYTCLSLAQQKFLNTLLRKTNKVQLVEIDLSSWKEDPESLHNILHKRGLLRLAAAISGQHPDFLWYITHRLDTGRAAIIKKHFSETEIPVYTTILAEQVLDTLKNIKTEKVL